jgi:hypothetical protein
MATERLLNNYYNTGGYNQPARIGYMINMIRSLKPLTEEEWKLWYIENVHDESYLEGLAEEMYQSIPRSCNVSIDECRSYIYDVMFRRTFQGYNKEKIALRILRDLVSPDVQEAPEDWDTEYFIDFFIKSSRRDLVGIQLKPETFYRGHYQHVVDISGKMNAFCRKYGAKAYVLKYRQSSDQEGIVFSNPDVIEEIRQSIQ